MFNGNIVNKIYLYDGTFEGILTLVFDLYVSSTIPVAIQKHKDYQSNFLTPTIVVKTEENKVKRIYHGILKNVSKAALYNCYHAFLSDDKNKEMDIVKYLLNGFKIGPAIDTMLYLNYVSRVQSLRKKVLLEAHRLTGLLRFMDIGNDVFYASLHPDNFVLEKIGQHFMRRLPTQKFVIHDKNRNLAFLHYQKKYDIVPVTQELCFELTEEEKDFQKLWKTFFETIAIKERTNPNLQRNYMPTRYWKDLVEIIIRTI